MLDIEVQDGGRVMLSGRFDASQAERAQRVLEGLEGSLVADLSELYYISSAGLGVLVSTHRRLVESGHSFRLIHLTPLVRNVFRFAGLERVLDIE